MSHKIIPEPGGGSSVHADLTGRDAASSHPAGAIEVTPTINGGDDVQEVLAGAMFQAAAKSAIVLTAESTTSSTLTDLTTPGPAVTATIGSSGRALVVMTAQTDHNTASGICVMAFAVTGATTVAASDDYSLVTTSYTAGGFFAGSHVGVLSGLNAGSNTFTAKYRQSGGGTGTFRRRHLILIPL